MSFACNESHPTRDGWIEMQITRSGWTFKPCPIPHGMGGLKFGSTRVKRQYGPGPIPHGMGGLKYIIDENGDIVKSPIPHGMGGLK